MSPSFTIKLTILIYLLGLFAYLVHGRLMLLVFFFLFAMPYSISASLCSPSFILKHTIRSIKRENTRNLHYLFKAMTKSHTNRSKYKFYS